MGTLHLRISRVTQKVLKRKRMLRLSGCLSLCWRRRSLQEHQCRYADEDICFQGADLNRSCGGAENWSAEEADQWMGYGKLLESVWPNKCCIRNWLQPDVAPCGR